MIAYSHDVTSVETWQKIRQKKATEEYRFVQETARRPDEKTPQETAEHGVLAT
jgi:hypothetical protein